MISILYKLCSRKSSFLYISGIKIKSPIQDIIVYAHFKLKTLLLLNIHYKTNQQMKDQHEKIPAYLYLSAKLNAKHKVAVFCIRTDI